jgi:integrase
MMRKDSAKVAFHSTLGPVIEQFIQTKQACGYFYTTEIGRLRELDRLFVTEGLNALELPRALAQKWTTKRRNESPRTHQMRITVLRQFARFLIQKGFKAHVPEPMLGRVKTTTWVAHIFRPSEIRSLLEAVDRLRPCTASPLRHLAMPLILRLLYGCGLRLSEVLKLIVSDVDLNEGVLTIHQTKFRKDRLVPVHPSLLERLKRYASAVGHRSVSAPFFPSPNGGHYARRTVQWLFRNLLWECRIPHGGRGRGPRVHDLRHTFAVHRLVRWWRERVDLNAKLPLLATYMGHEHLSGTQCYLQLTIDLFADVASRNAEKFGHVIPRRAAP